MSKMKWFGVDVFTSQQMAVMDIPGYSHMSEEKTSSFSARGKDQFRTAWFQATSVVALRKQIRTALENNKEAMSAWDRYMQGFNIVTQKGVSRFG